MQNPLVARSRVAPCLAVSCRVLLYGTTERAGAGVSVQMKFQCMSVQAVQRSCGGSTGSCQRVSRVSMPGSAIKMLSCLHLLSRTSSLPFGSIHMLSCRHATASEGPSVSACQPCQRVRRVSVSGGSRFCIGTVQGCGSDGSCLVGAFL